MAFHCSYCSFRCAAWRNICAILSIAIPVLQIFCLHVEYLDVLKLLNHTPPFLLTLEGSMLLLRRLKQDLVNATTLERNSPMEILADEELNPDETQTDDVEQNHMLSA